MRQLIVFLESGPEQWEEGQNCDQIIDERGEYPIVKIYIKEKIRIYKGIPFALIVNRIEERGRKVGPVRPSSRPGTELRFG